MASNNLKNGSEWNLSVLLGDTKLNEIQNRVQDRVNEANVIENTFKNKIDSSNILEVLKKLENIYKDLYEVFGFAHLTLSADQNNNSAKELRSKIQTSLSQINSKFVFIELEIGKLLSNQPEIILKPELKPFKHYLEKILRRNPYQLSEIEEQLSIEKNLNGINEWAKIKAQWLATRKFKLIIDGKQEEVSWSTGYKYFSSQNHDHRLEAVKKMLGGLGEDKEFFGTAFRAICNNYVLEAKRRKYSILESSCIANDIEEKMVTNMFSAIENNIGMFQEFLKFKANLYGTDKLRGEDLDGPYPDITDKNEIITWEEAQNIVYESFNNFDSELGSFIKDMYDNNRIDSLQKPAKVSGAFCSTWFKGKSAFVLQSFNNNIDSVSTLAHELGHAIHSYLSTRKQNFLSQHYPMVIAETASEFGRMLFIEDYLKKSTNKATKKKLLFQAVENLMIIIFEVGSRFRFEQSVYELLEAGDYLSPEKIDELFWKARKKYFGDAIEWHPEQAYHWIWKPHYYRIGLRFYNYPYTFAEMIVLALYNKYKQDGDSFVPKYKDFLASGGSKSPKELAEEMGLDLSSEEFWKSGLNEVKKLFEELKSLN